MTSRDIFQLNSTRLFSVTLVKDSSILKKNGVGTNEWRQEVYGHTNARIKKDEIRIQHVELAPDIQVLKP